MVHNHLLLIGFFVIFFVFFPRENFQYVVFLDFEVLNQLRILVECVVISSTITLDTSVNFYMKKSSQFVK